MVLGLQQGWDHREALCFPLKTLSLSALTTILAVLAPAFKANDSQDSALKIPTLEGRACNLQSNKPENFNAV